MYLSIARKTQNGYIALPSQIAVIDRSHVGTDQTYQQPGDQGELQIHTKEWYAAAYVTPSQPTGLVSQMLNLSQVSDVDDLVGATFRFCEGQNLTPEENDLLSNFRIYVLSTYSNRYLRLLIGDLTHGCFWRVEVDTDSEEICFGTRLSTATTLSDMLAQAKSEICPQGYNSSLALEKWMSSPQYAPFVPLIYNKTNATYFYANNKFSWLTGLNTWAPGLQHWDAWYLMLTGDYYNASYIVTFDLDTAVTTVYDQEIDHIDVAFPLLHGMSAPDPGRTYQSGYDPTPEWDYYSIGAYTPGTQLNVLFQDHTFTSAQSPIDLAIGAQLVRTVDGNQMSYSIMIDNDAIVSLGANDTTARYYDYLNPTVNTAEQQPVIGLQLMVHPDWADKNPYEWIDDIASDYDTYTWGNSPLYIMTYICGPLISPGGRNNRGCYPDYLDQSLTKTDAPGLVWGWQAEIFGSEYYAAVDDTDSISHAFWDILIGGFVPEPWIPSWGSGKGINRGTGGGKGIFDDSSTDIPLPNAIDFALGSNMRLYEVSSIQLDNLLAWLSDSSQIDKRQELVGNIAKLYYLPLPSTPAMQTTQTITLGGRTTTASGNVITDYTLAYDYTMQKIDEYFGSFLDYEPHTQIFLYLPGVGIQKIDPAVVLGKDLTLRCNVNLLTGDVCWALKSGDTTIYYYDGNLSLDIPISVNDPSKLNNALLALAGGVATAGVSAAMANPIGVLGGIASAAGGVMQAHNAFDKSITAGDLSGGKVFLTYRLPFLIIRRPVLSIPETFAHEYGYMYNGNARLSSLTGMTVVSSCHVDGITGATEDDIKEIEELLHSGVIL